MRIAVEGRTTEVHRVIRQLLFPWRIAFTCLDEADVLIVYGERPPENMKTIVIPSDSIGFVKWLKDEGLNVVGKLGTQTLVAATQQITLSMIPQIQYYYSGSNESISSVSQPPPIKLNDDALLLTVNIIEEYSRIMSEALNPKLSILYRLLTGLPIPYAVAPKRIRNFLMEKKAQQTSLSLYDKLPLDAIRFLLARSLEEITDEKLMKKTWNGKKYACAVTHDVDTCLGLKRGKTVKKLEQKYDLPSAWYIPSKHYKVDSETVRMLGNHGEIGAHDTKHDGKLANLPEKNLVRRLHEAKQTLEEITNHPVIGFRAPLLQHNAGILDALKVAGYTYDTSIPTWEPKHPQTMRPHGVGTTYPIFFDSVTEIPISVVQDHQLLYALGLEPKEAIAEWLSMNALIKELGSCCVLLSHPEYKLFDVNNLAVYEELLNIMASDEQVWLATPKQLADEAGK